VIAAVRDHHAAPAGRLRQGLTDRRGDRHQAIGRPQPRVGVAVAPLGGGIEKAAEAGRELVGGAADRVAALMEQRLRAALERELARCTLAELLYDLRSVSAELSDEGGLLLG
jgi:hypothetical protein